MRLHTTNTALLKGDSAKQSAICGPEESGESSADYKRALSGQQQFESALGTSRKFRLNQLIQVCAKPVAEQKSGLQLVHPALRGALPICRFTVSCVNTAELDSRPFRVEI